MLAGRTVDDQRGRRRLPRRIIWVVRGLGQKALLRALRRGRPSRDEVTLAKYGRFLNPILEELIESDPTKANRLRKY